MGVFAGDDWRVRPNFTVSLGLRYETQTNIHDWRDLAPRIGLAWAPGVKSGKSQPKTVIRAGFGIFYDRFALANTITARRYDGVLQQQYVVTNPNFFPQVPDVASLPAAKSTQTIQKVSDVLRAPYIMQSALSVERQLPFNTTIAVTYANTHGLHILRSQDVNAPLPGTFNPLDPGSGVYPQGKPGPVFLMESSGLYNQNQLITNVNAKVNKDISLFGSYVVNSALSNTDGLTTFPGKPYSLEGEYGPASTDIRNRASVGGSISTKWDIRLNPLLVVDSGPPFDITVGRDLYGTTLFNARPAIATDPGKPGLVETVYGLLDPNPVQGQPALHAELRARARFRHAQPARRQDVRLRPGGGPRSAHQHSRRRAPTPRQHRRIRAGSRESGRPCQGKPPVQRHHLHVDPEPLESHQSRPHHRQHHFAPVRSSQPASRQRRRRRILRSRQQPPPRASIALHVLTYGSFTLAK